MILRSLRLENFRNYRQAEVGFDPGVNLLLGDNAQGKTNLLEAVCYLGSGKSFRAQHTGELLRFGAEFAQAEGAVFSQEREQTLRWVLFAGRKPRQLYQSGVKKKTAGEIAGVLPTVLFCPEDLLVLKAGAAQRRRFADSVLCQLRPNYDAALAEYGRILERKSRILKEREGNPAMLEILPEYNERLCRVGALLISYRARFFQALGQEAAVFHRQFSGGSEEFRLEYTTVSTVTDPMAGVDTLTENLLEHLHRHARAELDSAQCLTGPHRDDFTITLSGRSLKAYGSQGQVRTAAISLKLAQKALMRREFGEEPVLLLDDVLSELDPGRQDFVLNRITDGQVFITCCEPERIPRIGKVFRVQEGKIHEE